MESVSRLATVLDLESPPKLESTDLLLVLISLLCELLLLWRFLTFRNILHHDDRIQPSSLTKPSV